MKQRQVTDRSCLHSGRSTFHGNVFSKIEADKTTLSRPTVQRVGHPRQQEIFVSAACPKSRYLGHGKRSSPSRDVELCFFQ